MAKVRKDKRGRNLHKGEYQRPDGRYAYVRSAFSSAGGRRTGSGCRPLGPLPAAPVHIDRAPLPATEVHSAR